MMARSKNGFVLAMKVAGIVLTAVIAVAGAMAYVSAQANGVRKECAQVYATQEGMGALKDDVREIKTEQREFRREMRADLKALGEKIDRIR